MSSFAHIKQDPVFNSVVKTTVPPRWDALLNEKLPSTVDTSLEGITRTVYERPDPKFPLNGEIWKASGVAGDPSPALTFKVTGHLQMYVVSGAGEITKNGAPINLRPGEKVAFNTDDTFSIDRNSALTLFVRNEQATFKVEAEASTMKLSAIRMPSAHEVALTRAMLGIEPEPTERRWPERKVPSSRGYARSKAG
jgi:hypothetical protein